MQVAYQMGKKAAEIGSQFTVSLGDNFYGDGVKNVDDPRFQETYEVSNLTLSVWSQQKVTTVE